MYMFDFQIQPTALRISPTYVLYYKLITLSALVIVGPFVLILTLALLTANALRRNAANRRNLRVSHFRHIYSRFECIFVKENTANGHNRQSTVQHNNETAATRLSLVLSAKFLLCNMLTVFLTIVETVLGVHFDWFLYLVDVSNFLVVLNSATNFFVYFRWRRFFQRQHSTLIANSSTPHVIVEEAPLSREHKLSVSVRMATTSKQSPYNVFLTREEKIYLRERLANLEVGATFLTTIPQDREQIKKKLSNPMTIQIVAQRIDAFLRDVNGYLFDLNLSPVKRQMLLQERIARMHITHLKHSVVFDEALRLQFVKVRRAFVLYFMSSQIIRQQTSCDNSAALERYLVILKRLLSEEQCEKVQQNKHRSDSFRER